MINIYRYRSNEIEIIDGYSIDWMYFTLSPHCHGSNIDLAINSYILFCKVLKDNGDTLSD